MVCLKYEIILLVAYHVGYLIAFIGVLWLLATFTNLAQSIKYLLTQHAFDIQFVVYI